MITSQILKLFGSTKKKQEPKIFRVKHYPAKFTSSESTVETLEKGVKYVQS